MEQKIKTILVTHKDRFGRFGYDWFKKFCMKFNTTIVVVNKEEPSPQEELVQDIVSILHAFSCRLYGLRKYKKQIEGDGEIAKELQDGKGKSDVKMYFVKNNPKDCRCERHRINIPSLGWVRVKKKGYIPVTKDGYVIKSGLVSTKAGRFYVSVLAEIPDSKITTNDYSEGIGIDLGLKDFAIISNGKTYKNINKSATLKKLEKRLIREQRCLSRRYENLKEGESTQKANIQKQKLKVQKLYHRIDNVRRDYMNKTIAEIVKTKPSYITIENLNVSGMMKNRHLSKTVASQRFYEFKVKLQAKCKENGIELRVADRWYPSSRTCHCCGAIKKDLKLSDRIFRCNCGYVEDRDMNAALNLKDAKTYEVAL